jgi:hypothetical protein
MAIPAPAILAAPPVNSGVLVRVEVASVPTEGAASEIEAGLEFWTEEVEARLEDRLDEVGTLLGEARADVWTEERVLDT